MRKSLNNRRLEFLIAAAATLIVISMQSAEVSSYTRETVASFHFTGKSPLGADISIIFTTPDGQDLSTHIQALPSVDPVIPLNISFPDGTTIQACVKNMDTNSEYRCGSAQVEFGNLDYYLKFPS